MSAATRAVPSRQTWAVVRQRFYRPELDCLRFFAFLAVFFFHNVPADPSYFADRHIPVGWLFASASRAGSFGVDLFFLLSAYLITELLLREKDEFGVVHVKQFYLRRILRIWPLYFFLLLTGTALCRLDPDQKFPGTYLLAFLFLSGNWMTSLIGFTPSVLNPLWSVSFEEQFYLIWPSIVAKARSSKALVIVSSLMVVAAAAGRLILLKYARGGDTAVFTNTIARLDPLAAGILTAVITHSRRVVLSRWARFGLLSSGVLVWLLCGHFYHENRSFLLIGYPAMAVGSWLLFMSVFGTGFAPRWLRYLGKISYGLYAFHMFAMYLADRLIGGHARNWGKLFVFWGLGMALTIALAAVSYHLFESRFLALKDRFAYVKSRPV